MFLRHKKDRMNLQRPRCSYLEESVPYKERCLCITIGKSLTERIFSYCSFDGLDTILIKNLDERSYRKNEYSPYDMGV